MNDHNNPHLNLTHTPAGPSTPTPKDKTKTTAGKAGSGPPPLDWTAGHGPISGALSATSGAAAVALLGTATGMPEAWPLAIGAAGALGHGIGHSLFRRMTGRSIAVRASAWLLAGGWTTWAMTTGPLTWAAAGSLTALGVGISAAASNAALHEEAAHEIRVTAQAREQAAALSAERRTLAAEWEDRIQRVCQVTVRVFAVEQWASDAGYSLGAELPGGGATWDQIAARARALAGDARLPLGCTVHVEEGDLQGRLVLDVATRNVMADEIPYPTNYQPLSILTGIPWGVRPTSEPIEVFLREACALILGPPGSGKSTFMDAVIAGFARCTDVLTWVIDLKAGAVGIPWMRPWLEAQGHIKPLPGTERAPQETRPGVDWLASTPAEALRMLDALLAINAARQQAYQDLMAQKDTTLLPVSPQIPQIELIVDEGAEALTATYKDPQRKAVGDKLRQVMRTTRAMGARAVLTAVDGNVSAIGDTQVRKFSPVGVALTSGESAGNNVSKLFPRARVDTRQLTQKGAGVVGDASAEGFAPTEFKGWKTGPAMVRAVVLATNHTRPTLDQPSAEAAGEAYTQRWNTDRAGWLWKNTTPTPTAPTDEPTEQAPTTRPGLNLTYRKQPTTGSGDADQLAAELMRQIDEEYGTTTEPDHHHSLNLTHTPTPNGDNDARTTALTLILESGPDGTGASALERSLRPKFGTTRPTIQGWLKEWAEQDEIVRVGTGPRTRYVHSQHAPPSNDDE